MGDRSPKSNRKLASQKQTKTDHADQRKRDEIVRGQQTKAALAAKGKK